MRFIEGEGRHEATLFPVVLDDLVPPDHICRVIDTFVSRLAMSTLGFERAEAADTGRPGYDPRRPPEALSLRIPESDSFITAFGN